MGVFEMVVSVTAIGVVGGVLSEAIKRKGNANKAELQELQRKVERLEKLEERVQTIETIVTDSKESLKREIDAL